MEQIKKIYYVLVFFVALSCKNSNTLVVNSNALSTQDTIYKNDTISRNDIIYDSDTSVLNYRLAQDICIPNDSLMKEIYLYLNSTEFKYSLKSLHKNSRPVINKFNPQITDSIVDFFSNYDQIQYYITNDGKSIIRKALISDTLININNIKIGCSRDVVLNKIKRENNKDTLIICDGELNSFIYFIFHEKELKGFQFYGYVDSE